MMVNPEYCRRRLSPFAFFLASMIVNDSTARGGGVAGRSTESFPRLHRHGQRIHPNDPTLENMAAHRHTKTLFVSTSFWSKARRKQSCRELRNSSYLIQRKRSHRCRAAESCVDPPIRQDGFETTNRVSVGSEAHEEQDPGGERSSLTRAMLLLGKYTSRISQQRSSESKEERERRVCWSRDGNT